MNGVPHSPSRHGHGVQRSVMIAMLQASASREIGSNDAGEEAWGTSISGASNLQVDTKRLIVAIEEPEIYQHPVKVRHLAHALNRMAEGGKAQVLIATHSPVFVRPDQFGALRRLRKDSSESIVLRAAPRDIASVAGVQESKVQKKLRNELPSSFSDGFFADRVLLVEGPTDVVVLEAVAELLHRPLAQYGVYLLDGGGKEGMHLGSAILRALGTDVYEVFDGDAEGWTRRKPDVDESRARRSNQLATEKCLERQSACFGVARLGALPVVFGHPTTVTSTFAMLHDDLEAELATWESFMNALHACGGELRKKDAHLYRTAALDAQASDCPISLQEIVLAATDAATP